MSMLKATYTIKSILLNSKTRKFVFNLFKTTSE